MFSAHNIRLDDGALTKPDAPFEMSRAPEFLAAKRVLNLAFPEGLKGKRIVDLGCLEGGHTVEFARLGMDALGVEVRQTNFDNCMLVKSSVNLPNLNFIKASVWDAPGYGPFDAVWCCGLLYHLDRPREFVRQMSAACGRVMIFHTHFSSPQEGGRWHLSPMTENEGLQGRWFGEPSEDSDIDKWASWGNRKSFWPTRPYLLSLLHENGFDCVLEQYDWIVPPIVNYLSSSVYDRGVFIGIRSF